MMLMSAPSVDDMCQIALDVIRKNAPKHNVYLRPVVYKKGIQLGPVLVNVPDAFMCYMQSLGDYFDASKGLQVCVSSWRRLADNMIPTRAKATGGYLNSALAKSEAIINGYDEAIFLNDRNQVSEGSAENIFLVRDGILHTPDRTSDILEGITRLAIINLAKELGITVQERAIARTELYHADEIFLCGTGCQVSWVRSVDKREVGAGVRGPLTIRLQEAYENAAYGRNAAHAAWLTKA